MTRPPQKIVIVGGGIIGLAAGLRATERWPGSSITILEKEVAVGQHQSGHNSGVLHAGLYYQPGSLKARLAVHGIRRMIAFCQEHEVKHEICGKLVVAVTEDEVPRLKELYERGTANGLSGLRWCGPEQIREREPHVRGVAAVEVPEEGIVDYPAVCRAMQAKIKANGGEVRTASGLQALRRDGDLWHCQTVKEDLEADYLINCAGLQCDRVMALTGETPATRIIPFRGEYFKLRPEAQKLVRHLIYPVPDPKFPFLGVHYTRMIHGGIECGPNAVLALEREGYSWSDFSLRDTFDSLRFPGLWKFLAKYPGMSWYEVKRSLSRAEFTRSLQRLVPEVQEQDLLPGGSGVRAQAMAPDGTLLQDFAIELRPGALHLLNAPSPGATASLAIADHLLDQIKADGR
ncbi:L-2-hydroxyglutarate oxidase [Bryobacter aggregatus]|uniref:L-2-hydroxyglutarate oxidase n=1 Tax=Bryobacter aggregatus TaxID=360054 RepID=UPI0004E238D8|nr:L-2-hydroxyglutarate oxidase [Bryobacter aggregatus]